ncbi:outer membrane lipoprotein-sorting protein [Motiliproteus sp. MSK22-1]|uniref:outer membrane lipoprotein-sorting protein n=1 Tax=Motiliproteus sp. MSK22-1 TaxID=1897630 RepID=UPI0009776F2A|nr:outer membrane lipoprotein-sorting protein [Motiliproteus sp. MSK22-1]OMH29121.1 hypothetical protein BGP75_20430 [Motiliproteus sp. MSK22-1]
MKRPALLKTLSTAIASTFLFTAGAQATTTQLNTQASPPPVKSCQDVLLGIQNRYNGYDSWRIVKMKITDENGNVKRRTITATHQNSGINRYLRSRVLEPAELRDTEAFAVDSFEDGKADKVWLYMPSTQKTLDVESKDLSGRLYGSDIAIGEMLIRLARDYDCKMLGEGEYKGYPVYKLYVNPNNEDEVIRLGLRDGEVWVEKDTFLPVHSTFNADAPNEQRIFDTDVYRWINGVFAPEKYSVSTRKDGRIISTSLFQNYGEQFNIGLPKDWYSPESLGSLTTNWREFRTESMKN